MAWGFISNPHIGPSRRVSTFPSKLFRLGSSTISASCFWKNFQYDVMKRAQFEVKACWVRSSYRWKGRVEGEQASEGPSGESYGQPEVLGWRDESGRASYSLAICVYCFCFFPANRVYAYI